MTTDEFIELACQVHGNKYDYSKVDIEHRDEKGRICIICPTHGEFWQKPSHHLDNHGCKRCASSKKRKARIKKSDVKKTENFIKKAKLVHGDKYDYSKVEYINYNTNVTIICPKHGEFHQTPSNHLQGKGCKYCAIDNSRITQSKGKETFVNDCLMQYGTKYDYNEVTYVNKKTKVRIKCNKCGKIFQMTPHNHLTNREGCPFCKESKLEKNVEFLLLSSNIEYEKQKTFDWTINGKSIKKFDFYLPKINVAIECQGLQHFKQVEWFGGEESYKKTNKE